MKKWNILNENIAFGKNLTETILNGREIYDVNKFLNPSKKDYIDEFKLLNMDKAVQKIISTIKNEKKIMILADVDGDGITSGVIMYKYLSNFISKDNLNIYINQGKVHGITEKFIDEIVGKYDLLIACDSLSDQLGSYQYLQLNKTEVLLIDHHPIKENNFAITVNSTNNYENPQLSGAGVVWKTCMALDKIMKTNYAKDLVDLACVGIIADMMDVKNSYENRYICNLGFNNLKNMAIKEIVGSYGFDSNSISYSIAPLINSAQRMNKNDLALKLFLSEDKKEIKKIINEIKLLKEQQNSALYSIIEKLEIENDFNKNNYIIAIIENKELTGLLANNLGNKYYKPTIILNEDIDGFLRGSMRGIGIDNFKNIINNTKLARCSGHDNAGGITINKEDLVRFKYELNEIFKNYNFEQDIDIDIDIALDYKNINQELINELNKINKITGTGFKPITILFKDIEIYDKFILKENKHTKFVSEDIDLIKWNHLTNEKVIGKKIDVIGTPQISWFNRKLQKQIIISDYIIKEDVSWLDLD